MHPYRYELYKFTFTCKPKCRMTIWALQLATERLMALLRILWTRQMIASTMVCRAAKANSFWCLCDLRVIYQRKESSCIQRGISPMSQIQCVPGAWLMIAMFHLLIIVEMLYGGEQRDHRNRGVRAALSIVFQVVMRKSSSPRTCSTLAILGSHEPSLPLAYATWWTSAILQLDMRPLWLYLCA